MPHDQPPGVHLALPHDGRRRCSGASCSNTFAGSAFKLVQSALADDRASAEELEAIGKLIAQAKSRRKK